MALEKRMGPLCTLLDIAAKKPLPSRRFVRKVRIRCRGRMALPAVKEVCRWLFRLMFLKFASTSSIDNPGRFARIRRTPYGAGDRAALLTA